MRTASSIAALMACLGFGLGCSGKKKAAPPVVAIDAAVDAAAVVVAVDAAGPSVDAGPPPLTPPAGARGVQIVDLQYAGFEAPGLPAIRDDGSQVAAIVRADDGGRGYLDLRFVLLDGATGKVAKTIRLADPNESSAAESKDDEAGNLDAEEALFAKVRTRVADANAVVATGTWRSLVTTERADDNAPPGPSEALTVGDLTFTYDLGGRKLSVARAGRQVAAHDLTRLVPKAGPDTDTPCPGDLGYLRALHVDAATKKVLVEIGAWPQGHNCGGNGPIYTVIPLP